MVTSKAQLFYSILQYIRVFLHAIIIISTCCKRKLKLRAMLDHLTKEWDHGYH